MTFDNKPAGRHPSTEELAEFADGALNPSLAATIQRHTADCDACAQTIDSLTAVTVMLRDAPASIPIPAEMSARVVASVENAADARAAERDREAEAAFEVASGGPVAWFRRKLPRALAATTGVGVIALAGYIAVEQIGTPAGDDATTADRAVPEDPAEDGAGEAELDTDAPEALEEFNEDAEAGSALARRGELAEAIDRVWRDELTFGDTTCGQPLAEELDLALVGSDEYGDNVLIVLELPDVDKLHGWVVPACASISQESVDDLEVPVPAP